MPSDDTLIAKIDLAPLTGLMLVLLTVLILALPAPKHRTSIDSGPGPGIVRPGYWEGADEVFVAFDGAVAWNGRRVSDAGLKAAFARAARQTRQPGIEISADHLTRYDDVARVLTMAKRHGLTRVGFVAGGNIAR